MNEIGGVVSAKAQKTQSAHLIVMIFSITAVVIISGWYISRAAQDTLLDQRLKASELLLQDNGPTERPTEEILAGRAIFWPCVASSLGALFSIPGLLFAFVVSASRIGIMSRRNWLAQAMASLGVAEDALALSERRAELVNFKNQATLLGWLTLGWGIWTLTTINNGLPLDLRVLSEPRFYACLVLGSAYFSFWCIGSQFGTPLFPASFLAGFVYLNNRLAGAELVPRGWNFFGTVVSGILIFLLGMTLVHLVKARVRGGVLGQYCFACLEGMVVALGWAFPAIFIDRYSTFKQFGTWPF